MSSLKGLALLGLMIGFGGEAEARRPVQTKWQKQAKQVSKLGSVADKSTSCTATDYVDLSSRHVLGKTAEGRLCAVYDLSFPTLSSLFSKKPVSNLRVKKPSLSDYKVFLDNKGSEERARSFLNEDLSKEDLEESWYSKLKFKNERALRKNSEGLVEEFQYTDLETFKKKIGFKKADKELLVQLLLAYGSDKETAQVFANNPRSILDNMKFKYDSLKRAYEVFLDFEFLPIRGPIKLVDHDLQYRGWLQKQIRSLVLSALNTALAPVSASITGRLALVVLNDAFELIEMTYDFQRMQLDQVLRMALEGEIKTDLNRKELLDTLYLLYVQDSSSLMPMVFKFLQTGHLDLDSLYGYGKTAAVQAKRQRVSLSDKYFSQMHYEKNCDLKSMSYYFAYCAGESNIYSLLSETSIFFWSFGNPKIINLDSPWEVLLKRSVTYLLSSAVEVNFLYFPDWISSQVSGALKAYSVSGLMDEALVLSELYERKSRGESLNSFEAEAFEAILSKNMIPFLPKSLDSLESVIAKQRQALFKN